mmetsp:Transcript_3842/g.9193  ORF Transcript_3842/g.9193 Transcript_3842/m.9193 type:complete len:83 (-) Transcript_3842:138-386(-)
MNALLLLGAIGTAGFLGQLLLTLGLQRSHAGRGTIMRYLEVPLAFTFGVVFLGEIPTVRSVVGSLLILASASCIVLRSLSRR